MYHACFCCCCVPTLAIFCIEKYFGIHILWYTCIHIGVHFWYSIHIGIQYILLIKKYFGMMPPYRYSCDESCIYGNVFLKVVFESSLAYLLKNLVSLVCL